ncbi:MAG TPA: DUF952 domain-containing protein [Anaerolineales bacterium]
MSEMIFHITLREAWNAAQKQGQYTAPSLTSDGFIHGSTRAQVLPVAEKFYKGQDGLILLVIDPTRLSSRLKWEAPFDGAPPAGVSAGEAFPHIYGPINLDAVVQVLNLESTADGKFVLPTIP